MVPRRTGRSALGARSRLKDMPASGQLDFGFLVTPLAIRTRKLFPDLREM